MGKRLLLIIGTLLIFLVSCIGSTPVIKSPDGKRSAQITAGFNSHKLTIDDRDIQTEYSLFRGFEFSPDSKHYAYIAKGRFFETVVIDGIEGKRYTYIVSNKPIFSRDSTKVGYVANEEYKWNRTVINGTELELKLQWDYESDLKELLEMPMDLLLVYSTFRAAIGPMYDVNKLLKVCKDDFNTLSKRWNEWAELMIRILESKSMYSDINSLKLMAALAVGEFKDVRSIDALIANLSESDEKIRQAAALSLGKLKEKRAIEPLIITAINDTSPAVRRTAAEAVMAYQDQIGVYPEITLANYISLAKSLIQFLNAVQPNNINSYTSFIESHPENPFVIEARTQFPILWLKAATNRVGVIIDIQRLINKGVFGGLRASKEEIISTIWEEIRKDIEKENMQPVLLNDIDSARIGAEITAVVVVSYAESEEEFKREPKVGGLLAHAVDGLAESITRILYNPAIAKSSYAVKNARNATTYYAGFSTLFSSEGKINKIETLRAISDNKGLLPLMLALREKNIAEF